MTSLFYRIHYLRRKYYLSLLKLMNLGIHYYGLSFSFYVVMKRGKGTQKHSISLSLYRFSSQRDTPAINLSL